MIPTWVFLLSVLLAASYITRTSGHGCTITKHSTAADCTGLGLKSIPKDLPPTLVHLDVSHNPIEVLRNGSFKHLIHLDSLSLEHCSMTKLESQAFQGLTNLSVLDLDSNSFNSDSFLPGVFEPLGNLKSISLKGCVFSYVTSQINRLTKLRNLAIQSSDTLTPGMCTLGNLNTLDVTVNNTILNGTFHWFRNTPIEQLTVSFITGKDAGRIENGFLSAFPYITSLSFQGYYLKKVTAIMKILEPLRDRTMDFIGLTHVFKNLHSPIPLTHVSVKPIANICVRRLDLSHNQIGKIQRGVFSYLKYPHCLESINLSFNQIFPQSIIFLRKLGLPSLKFLDLSSQVIPGKIRSVRRTKNVYDNQTYSGNFDTIRKTLRLPSENLRHTIDVYAPPSLEIVNISDFLAKNLKVYNVLLVHNNTLKVLDLSGTDLATSCRQILAGLYKLKHLNVSRLQCSSLSKDFFRNYTSLEELVFKSSHLDVGLTDEVSIGLLSGLSLLKYVDFSGNKLVNLHDSLFTSQRNVLKTLTLANNQLTGVPNNIKYLDNLSKLDITSNVISSLGTHDRLMLENHRAKVPNFRLLLKGNPFECNCQTVNFIEWIYTTKLVLDDPSNYMCTDRTGVNMTMVSIYNKLPAFRETCVDKTWLIFSICASILFVLVLVTVAVGYRYRVSLNYCCLVIRRRYRGYHGIEGDTTQYKYDAFVAYNFEDYRFVCNDLIDHVEKEMNLKLCLHHRDFPPAVDITDNIMDAISESKWIILVITKSFLSSTWGQFELEMSRRHMFQRNSSNLIVIILEDIDKITMPKRLYRIYNQITCLEHPGRKTYLQWKDSDYDREDAHLFWAYLQNTLQT